MSLFKAVSPELKTALNTLGFDNLDHEKVTVEPPRDPSHGDLSTNAAMVLCKQADEKPRDLAEKIADQLNKVEWIESVEIAGPGFINLRLATSAFTGQLATILNEGTNFGQADLGKGARINIEYVSANPTGPLTVGQARGAVVGDATANLLVKAGYNVHREYYTNDAGNQVRILGQSAYLRYREALGEDIGEIPQGHYPGEYLKDIGEALAAKYGDALKQKDEEGAAIICRDFAIEFLMNEIKTDLKDLGISHDMFFSEKEMVDRGAVEGVLKHLENQGLIYTGILEAPKGKTPEDWEARPQTLFKSTEFGDDVDRPIKKADGSFTYFANDVAHYYEMYQKDYPQLINVVGADHGGYVKRASAAVKAVTGGKGKLDFILCQIVHTYDNGKPVRMSKRAGTFVTLRDMMDRAGADVLRFIMLTRKSDQTLDFDFAKVTEASKDNPVFYVQYAHARCCSVMRHAAEMFTQDELNDSALAKADLSPLGEAELEMIKVLLNWPRIVEQAATALEPHRIAFYLQDVASAFHSWWNKGKDDATMRFLIEDDKPLTLARLALLRATAITIASALEIMGVEPVKRMDNSQSEAA